MKTIILFGLLFAAYYPLHSQIPQTVGYQGVAVIDGKPVIGTHNVHVQLFNREFSSTSKPVFEEDIQNIIFNNTGHYDLAIGSTNQEGFKKINWLDGKKTLRVLIKGIEITLYEFKSVPFALNIQKNESTSMKATVGDLNSFTSSLRNHPLNLNSKYDLHIESPGRYLILASIYISNLSMDDFPFLDVVVSSTGKPEQQIMRNVPGVKTILGNGTFQSLINTFAVFDFTSDLSKLELRAGVNNNIPGLNPEITYNNGNLTFIRIGDIPK